MPHNIAKNFFNKLNKINFSEAQWSVRFVLVSAMTRVVSSCNHNETSVFNYGHVPYVLWLKGIAKSKKKMNIQ